MIVTEARGCHLPSFEIVPELMSLAARDECLAMTEWDVFLSSYSILIWRSILRLYFWSRTLLLTRSLRVRASTSDRSESNARENTSQNMAPFGGKLSAPLTL